MRLLIGWMIVLSTVATCRAQAINRANLAGTNEFSVTPLRATPKIAWQINPGYRDGGPMVLAGGVLITGNINGDGGTFGYDAATGKRLWSVPGHLVGGLTVDGGSAYAVNNEGGGKPRRLSKIDVKTGRALWTFADPEIGGDEATPLAADGRVYVAGRHLLLALDAASGKLVWQHKDCDIADGGLALAGGVLYVAAQLAGDKNNFAALEAASGKPVWTMRPSAHFAGDHAAAPVVVGNLVVTRVGYEIFGIDAQSGRQRWKQGSTRQLDGHLTSPQLAEPAVTGGVIYCSWEGGILGFDAETGRQVFEFPSSFPDNNATGRMAVAGNVLYFSANNENPRSEGSGRGYLYALDLTTKEILWKYHASTPDKYNPLGRWPTRYFVLADRAVYFENQSKLAKLTE